VQQSDLNKKARKDRRGIDRQLAQRGETSEQTERACSGPINQS